MTVSDLVEQRGAAPSAVEATTAASAVVPEEATLTAVPEGPVPPDDVPAEVWLPEVSLPDTPADETPPESIPEISLPSVTFPEGVAADVPVETIPPDEAPSVTTSADSGIEEVSLDGQASLQMAWDMTPPDLSALLADLDLESLEFPLTEGFLFDLLPVISAPSSALGHLPLSMLPPAGTIPDPALGHASSEHVPLADIPPVAGLDGMGQYDADGGSLSVADVFSGIGDLSIPVGETPPTVTPPSIDLGEAPVATQAEEYVAVDPVPPTMSPPEISVPSLSDLGLSDVGQVPSDTPVA